MIREVRDRKGLPGDLSDGKSLAGRGGSKCKGPAAGAKFADTHKRAGVLGAGQARGRVARNEMSGVRAAGPVRTQKGSRLVKEEPLAHLKQEVARPDVKGLSNGYATTGPRVGQDRSRA